MGTKLKPGKFDCLKNAKPDEPVFVLLGRDPHAAYLARRWAAMRSLAIDAGVKPAGDAAQVVEALVLAEDMERYAQEHAIRGQAKSDR